MPTTAETIATNAGTNLAACNVTLNSAMSTLQSTLAEIHSFSTGATPMPTKPSVARTISLTAITTQLTTIQNALSGLVIGANTLVKPAYGALETPIWSETFWDNLKTTLHDVIGTVTNSTNVDDLIAQLTSDSTRTVSAIYNADLERKQQVLRDAFSAANAQTGHSGFTYPNSMTIAIQLNAQQDHSFALAQTSRDIIKQIFEWAKTSYQFSIGKQIDTHAADVEFNLKYRQMADTAYAEEARRLLLAYETEVSKKIALVEQAVTVYRVGVDAAKLDAELGVKEIELQQQAYSIAVQESLRVAQEAISVTYNYYNNRLSAASSAVTAAASAAASSGQLALGVFNGQ